jgi:autotransporter-associated beta strand protein
VAAVAIGLSATEVSAVTKTWDGGAGDSSLNSANNWNTDGVPVNGDIVQWNGTVGGNLGLFFNSAFGSSGGIGIDMTGAQTGNLTITNSAGSQQTFRLNNAGASGGSFTMQSGAGAFTLGGTGSAIQLVIGSTGAKNVTLTNNSASLATFGSNVTWVAGGGAGGVINVAGTGNFDILGNITGSGAAAFSIAKTGTGTLTLAGNNTGLNGVTNSGGTIAIGSANALGIGKLTINTSSGRVRSSDATARTITNAIEQTSSAANFGQTTGGTGDLTLTGTYNLGAADRTVVLDSKVTWSNTISGANRLIKGGNGKMVLSADNSSTFSGDFVAQGGEVALGHDKALGTGKLVINHGGTIISSADANARTIGNNVIFSNNASFGAAGTGNLNFTGAINASTANRTISVATNTVTFSGAITGSGAVITKAGGGTLVLSGDNSATLSSQISVSNGKLVVDNTSGSGTGTGAVTVNANGALGGSGTIAGNTTVNGKLMPGNSPGTLTFDAALTLTGTSETTFEIASLTSHDVLANDGGDTITFQDGATIVFNTTGYTVNVGDSFLVLSNWNGYAGTVANLNFTGTDLGAGKSLDTSSFLTTGYVTVIPEPVTIGMMGFGALMMLILRRRMMW